MGDANVTTTTEIPAPVDAYYDRVLLERALPLLVHDKWAQMRPIPKGNSSTIRFRKYTALDKALVPLAEGITPIGKKLSKTDITTSLAQYGDIVTITDMVEYTVPDGTVTEAVELQGEQAGQTLDEICKDTLLGSASVYYAENESARADVDECPTDADIVRLERTLRGANAKMITDMILPGSGYNTTPIPPCYIWLCHTDSIADIRALTGFIPVEQYSAQKQIHEGEIGSVKNFRIIPTSEGDVVPDAGDTASTNAVITTTGTDADIYRSIILGKNAYGACPLEGEGLNFYMQKMGEGDDTLHQRTKVGWKATTAYRILNDAFMLIFEHANSV